MYFSLSNTTTWKRSKFGFCPGVICLSCHGTFNLKVCTTQRDFYVSSVWLLICLSQSWQLKQEFRLIKKECMSFITLFAGNYENKEQSIMVTDPPTKLSLSFFLCAEKHSYVWNNTIHFLIWQQENHCSSLHISQWFH